MSQVEQARWFADEVKLHEPILRAYLRKRFPSLPDHDDIVQEVYIRILRAESKGNLTSCARAFLFTIARNIAIDLLRRRQRNPAEAIPDSEALPLLEEAPGVVESLERRQRREMLLEAMATLPARCREVVALRHLEGLSYKEIAERLGISTETVKAHLAKGLHDCTNYFQKRGQLKTSLPPAAAASNQACA